MTTQNDNEDASSSKVPVVTAGDDAAVNTKSTETVIPSTPATTTTMTIQLTLTALPGAPRIPLDVTLTDDTDTAVVTTSSDLRQLVSSRTNIPLSTLRLIYRGRLITDNTTDTTMNVITEYKLENGSVLHCMGKPSVTTTETSPEVVTASSTGTIAGNSIGSTPVTTNAAAPTSTVSATTATTPASASSTSSSSSSVPSLQSALETMRASNAMTIYAKCVKTLQKVLVNIIDHPLEEKYRTIKVNNAAFQKHFHHVHNSTTVLLACGFRWIHPDEPENAAYTMNASPEQWPTLLQSKATIDRAVQQSTVTASSITASAAAATGPGTMRPFGNNSSSSSSSSGNAFPFPPAGGAMPDPAALQQQIANVMSNPQQIQAMMQVRVFVIDECYHCSFFSHLSSKLLFLNFFTISYFMLYQGSYDSKYDSE